MANYSTTANVVLTVNGKQAQKMLSTLEKDAKRLEKGIAKAATAGDKATMKKLQRELNSTQKMMKQLRGTAFNLDNTFRRLDKATPKELNKALRQLQQQLNGIQRGTAAWDAHVAKIKAVKEELQRVNAAMSPQRSMWERMNIWLNNCQTSPARHRCRRHRACIGRAQGCQRLRRNGAGNGECPQVYRYDGRGSGGS